MAYIKDLRQLRKLNSRRKAVKFVGYTQTRYRFWDSAKRKIIVSRDVKFIEVESISNNDKIKNSKKTDNNKFYNDDENSSDDESHKSINDGDDEVDISDEDSEEDENNLTITENDNKVNEKTDTILRRSQREKKFPEKYNDYSHLTYEEVMNSEEKEKWLDAMRDEMKSLNKNKTWEIINVNEAKGKKCLTSRWIFQIKEDGKFTARLVGRGCEQKGNIDYEKLYSPVVDGATLRMLFALAAHNNWSFMKFDLKTAFLYEKLEEEICMYLPTGCEGNKGKICKLKKSIYGLKQSSNNWNKKFTRTLKKYDFK